MPDLSTSPVAKEQGESTDKALWLVTGKTALVVAAFSGSLGVTDPILALFPIVFGGVAGAYFIYIGSGKNRVTHLCCFIILSLVLAGCVFARKSVPAKKMPINSLFEEIKTVPPSLGGNTSIDIDHVGSLVVADVYDQSSIELFLTDQMRLPTPHIPGLKTENLRIFPSDPSKKYNFMIGASPTQIEVAGRYFEVKLLDVDALEGYNVKNAFRYRFGVTELR